MEKIHILGSSGFIGSYLFKKFNENKNYDVKGYSSKKCNLLNPESIKDALQKITEEDSIIMTSSIVRLKENSLESMVTNIKMADNISKFIEKNKVKRFIFLSTTDVYGIIEPNKIINEKLLLNPNDYYSVSKLSSEYILRKNCSDNNIPLFILRLSAAYGPNDDGKSTINKLVKSADEGKIIIKGDGKDKRDFIYIDDVYRIIQEGIANKTNTTLNIATGKSYSINRIVNIIKKYYPNDFLIEYSPKEKISQKRNKNMVFDISLFKENFPDFEFTDIEKGIETYIGTYKSL